MTRREERKLMLTDLVVCKFVSFDKQIAYVLGADIDKCKAELQKATVSPFTLEREIQAGEIIAYIEKKCKDVGIAFAEQKPIILHNEILPF